MTNAPQIFDTAAHAHKLRRMTQSGMFLQNLARDEIMIRLEEVNRSFTNPLVITDFTAVWKNHFENIVPAVDDLNIPPHTYDLIIHTGALHHMNDPIGQLIQAQRGLQPDGLFIGSFLGGESLTTLRQSLMTAELEATGGVSPRVNPMIDVRDAGALLQRAGFALPVADTWAQNVRYDNTVALMHDLRAIGEANILKDRLRKPTSRRVFKALEDTYPMENGRITAEFELMFLTGWAPHESQQQPLRPGSAQVSFTEIFPDYKIDPKD
ncbi:MAG: methyltransferase domain-containing protein [Planktomarina sp.]